MLGERGRKRSDVQVSVSPHPGSLGPDPTGQVCRYRDAGVDQLVLAVRGVGFDSLPAELDQLEAWAAAASR